MLIDRVRVITWDAVVDIIKFKASNKVVTETKRDVFSAIGSLFYPLDLKNSVIVKIKLSVQELWRRGLDWNTKIPDDLLREWNIWRENEIKLSLLNLPRWINFS